MGTGTAKRVVAAVVAGLVGCVVAAGPASAANPVPPGGSGSVCSGYLPYEWQPGVEWQTCSWADNNEYYFTVNFKNNSVAETWVSGVDLTWYRSRLLNAWCFQDITVYVPPLAVSSTPTSMCAFPRTRDAVQSWAIVTRFGQLSPTLQVL